jgi:superfamily II DNA or RNA helicase
MAELRDYQRQWNADILSAWQHGARHVLGVMPTGSGKTHTKTELARQRNVPYVAVAHRQELILQISCSLATFGIRHNLIAPPAIIKFCTQRHMRLFGRSFYDRNSDFAVAGVRTLLNHRDELKQFLTRVRLVDNDEAHHVLPTNQWGRALELMPNAESLGVTATPERCDGKGLDGIYEHIVLGPTPRDLINMGFLCDYRIFCPPNALDMTKIRTSSSSGEFVKKDVVKEVERSEIVGDVVSHYLRIAPGKRGLTFAVDVASAERIAQGYFDNGVPAAVVTAKTPDNIRTELLDRLAQGSILQLVNVDLFGEGMDCPALDVVSMARPTESYGLYVQQFGRALRPHPDKEHAIIIDHVNNVVRHGLPDAEREWTLGSRVSRRNIAPEDQPIPLTVCSACMKPYEQYLVSCPFCGHKPEPVERSTPKAVAGDLCELDPEVLKQMRGRVERQDGPPMVPGHLKGTTAELSLNNAWNDRRAAQKTLRNVIARYAGNRLHGAGENDREIHRRFFLTFGIDVQSAMELNTKDALSLQQRIERKL